MSWSRDAQPTGPEDESAILNAICYELWNSTKPHNNRQLDLQSIHSSILSVPHIACVENTYQSSPLLVVTWVEMESHGNPTH